MDTKELQQKQVAYDEKYWQHHKSDEKIRHILLHLGKLVGKVSTYSEAREHGKEPPLDQVRDEVIPDLFVYGLQLANLLDIDAEQAYLNRLKANILRLHSDQEKKR